MKCPWLILDVSQICCGCVANACDITVPVLKKYLVI